MKLHWTQFQKPDHLARMALLVGVALLVWTALGAAAERLDAGVRLPKVARIAGLCLVVMLTGMLPANVYAAINRVPFRGHGNGPAYLLARVPFQILVIAWVYLAAGRDWAGSAARVGSRRR